MTYMTYHFKIIDKTEKYTYVQKHYIKRPLLCANLSELLPFNFFFNFENCDFGLRADGIDNFFFKIQKF